MTDLTPKHSRNKHQKSDDSYQDLQRKIFELMDTQKSPVSPDRVNVVREANRKAYKRQKYLEYKNKWVRETLRFTPSEIEELTEIAKKYGLKRAPFIKACVYGYLQTTYILPNDQKVRTLELGINHIASSLNETIRYIHQHKQIQLSDIEKIKSSIERLELVVSSTMRTPPDLRLWIEEHIKQDDRFLERLKTVLNQIEHDH